VQLVEHVGGEVGVDVDGNVQVREWKVARVLLLGQKRIGIAALEQDHDVAAKVGARECAFP